MSKQKKKEKKKRKKGREGKTKWPTDLAPVRRDAPTPTLHRHLERVLDVRAKVELRHRAAQLGHRLRREAQRRGVGDGDLGGAVGERRARGGAAAAAFARSVEALLVAVHHRLDGAEPRGALPAHAAVRRGGKQREAQVAHHRDGLDEGEWNRQIC